MWLVITLPMRIIFRRSVRIVMIVIIVIIITIVRLIELSSTCNNKLTQHTEQYFNFF